MTKQPNLSSASNSASAPHAPHPKAKPASNDVKPRKSKQLPQPPKQRASGSSNNPRTSKSESRQAHKPAAGSSPTNQTPSPRKLGKENHRSVSSPANLVNEAKNSSNVAKPSNQAANGAPNLKWSGSTFHSSPNAATLPRPPFSKTSPPQSVQRLSSAPNLAAPPLVHSATPAPPFMPVMAQTHPNAYAFPGMYGMPVYPNMPFPHFAANNHPMAFNPMYMGPGTVPMAHPNPTET